MLMNFSPISIGLPEIYLTVDETDILVECEKLDEDFRLYGGNQDATVCKS